MGKSEEAHKQQVSHLEECLRKEIVRFEEVSAELYAVRTEALRRLEVQRGELAANEDQLHTTAEQHAAEVSEMDAEHS